MTLTECHAHLKEIVYKSLNKDERIIQKICLHYCIHTNLAITPHLISSAILLP